MKSGRRGPLIDIGQSSLKVRWGGRGLELELERSPGGALTPECRERAASELRRFLRGLPGRSRRALCALPARGVSLRRFELPPASREETVRLLCLQLEREFPLPPPELAWGYSLPGTGNGSAASARAAAGNTPALQEVTVAALRREVLDDYGSLLSGSGLRPVFGLGVLAASRLCPRAPGRSFLLDIGRTHCELLSFVDGKPRSVRSLCWGGELVTGSLSRALSIGRAEAEELKRRFRAAGHDGAGRDAGPPGAAAAVREPLSALAVLLREACWPEPGTEECPSAERVSSPMAGAAPPAARLFLTGGGSRLSGLPEELSRVLGEGTVCEAIEPEHGPGLSAVTRGLEREALSERNGSLRLESAGRLLAEAPGRRTAPTRTWLGAAVLLLILSLSLRYAAPLSGLRGLRLSLEAARQAREAMPRLDAELGFLEHLKANRAPYLEVLAALARAAPGGSLVESFSMTRSGQVSVKGSAGSLDDANSLRFKLAASGWLFRVVMEEVTPTKDQKKVEFRLSAVLKPAGSPPPPGAQGTERPESHPTAAEAASARGGAGPGEPAPPGEAGKPEPAAPAASGAPAGSAEAAPPVGDRALPAPAAPEAGRAIPPGAAGTPVPAAPAGAAPTGAAPAGAGPAAVQGGPASDIKVETEARKE